MSDKKRSLIYGFLVKHILDIIGILTILLIIAIVSLSIRNMTESMKYSSIAKEGFEELCGVISAASSAGSDFDKKISIEVPISCIDLLASDTYTNVPGAYMPGSGIYFCRPLYDIIAKGNQLFLISDMGDLVLCDNEECCSYNKEWYSCEKTEDNIGSFYISTLKNVLLSCKSNSNIILKYELPSDKNYLYFTYYPKLIYNGSLTIYGPFALSAAKEWSSRRMDGYYLLLLNLEILKSSDKIVIKVLGYT